MLASTILLSIERPEVLCMGHLGPLTLSTGHRKSVVVLGREGSSILERRSMILMIKP